MLVLERKLGESIKVGDSIEIKVLEMHNGHVKLGIAAPRHVLVLRSELVDRAEREAKAE